ncbi:pineapple eye protein isoform X2 [Drosophila tropicalis]|uniref:pineapple eye protein isoform X2 n=1 Tax=Drosophila tropicalis TaxID=46794 RepID=UPI0035AB8980
MGIRTCSICRKSSDTEEDELLYGEWMINQDITVHYFCLLLSTQLHQRGGDAAGILGFLLRDIRREIAAAKQRKCIYCQEIGASINCNKCGKCFHLVCGIEHHVVSEFCHAFRSFCEDCRPIDDYQKKLIRHPPQPVPICNICYKPILAFALHRVVYGDCCRKGFVHRTCMRRYALSSGYYLRCIWCRDEKFRDLIRLQSIFVPDRDATWERERHAYRELHTRHLTCQMKDCICTKGRDYNKNTWKILACKLCASTAAHLKCLPPHQKQAECFKCDTCEDVEKKLITNKQNEQRHRCANVGTKNTKIDSSFYMTKTGPSQNEILMPDDDKSPVVSDNDDTVSSVWSQVTVIPSQRPSADTCLIPKLQGHVMRPPLALKESFGCLDEPYFYLVIYEFDDQTDECTGTCTLRFKNDDDRIKDQSTKALEKLQLRDEDIWFRDSEPETISLLCTQ